MPARTFKKQQQRETKAPFCVAFPLASYSMQHLRIDQTMSRMAHFYRTLWFAIIRSTSSCPRSARLSTGTVRHPLKCIANKNWFELIKNRNNEIVVTLHLCNW